MVSMGFSQFKIIFEFTTVHDHAVETSESAPITTRSHGGKQGVPSVKVSRGFPQLW